MKKLISLFILVFLSGINTGAFAQAYVIIGSGTSSSEIAPLNRYYNYSTHEVIYLQSELGTAKTFLKVAYNKASGTDVLGIQNVTIYMKHTTASTLANGSYSLTGYTQVFNGTFTNNTTSGWMEVTLDNSFSYNGTDNLQILIIKGYQLWSNNRPRWYYSNLSSYRARNGYSDTQQPTYLSRTNSRPNIRLEYGNLPDPFNGIVNIGLSMFNLVTGRNLVQKEFTRIAYNYIPVQSDNSLSKIQKESEFENSPYDDNVSYKKVATTEVYYELYENGVPYDGSLYSPITEEQRKQYGIGGDASGVYATITAALSDLKQVGVSGPTTLTLLDQNYPSETFPLVVQVNNNLPTSTNTITLRPATNVNATISGSASSNALIMVIDLSYFTINGKATTPGSESLTIQNTSTSYPTVVAFGSTGTTPFTNVALKNSTIINGSTSSSAVVVSAVTGIGDPGYFSNVSIENNIIKKAYHGVYVNGGAAPTHSGFNLIVSGNTLTSSGSDAIRLTGIYMQGVDGATVSNNKIANFDGTNSEDDRGIWLASGTINAIVEKNEIYSLNYTGTVGYGCYGIAVTSVLSNCNNTVRNNVIYNISGDGYDYTNASYKYDNPFGIMCLSNQSGVKIYYNSINLYGNNLNHSNAISAGIALFNGSSAEITNNCIVNNLGLASSTGFGTVGIYTETNSNQLENSNYNNYYINPSGSGEKLVGKIGSNNYTDLTMYKTATGQDESSFNGDPGYTSNTNLIPDVSNPDCWYSNGKGVQISGISSDFNGNPRSTSIPGGATDIGAFEFTPTVDPPPALMGGGSDNTLMTLIFGERVLSTISWYETGTLPSSIDFKYFSGTNPPNPSGYYSNAYWEIIPTGGSNYVYDITLYYDNAILGTIGIEDDIRIAKSSDGITWQAFLTQGTGPGQFEINTTTKTITLYGLTNFSYFTLTDKNSPLPVELTSFTSSVRDRDVQLRWSTALEINNAGFNVERKAVGDGAMWSKIGFVQGNGTTNEPKNYSFEDKKLNTGKYDYRLKQIDYNNKETVFNLNNTVDVGIPKKSELSQNYPNPFNPVTKIDYNITYNSKVTLKIFDITGREISTLVNDTKEAGYYTVQFNASDFASGTYFYRLTTEGGKENFVITKRMIYIK